MKRHARRWSFLELAMFKGGKRPRPRTSPWRAGLARSLRLSVVSCVALLGLGGCRSARPTSMADWRSCVADHHVPADGEAAKGLSPVPGDGSVLMMNVEWGRSLVASEYSFAELLLALPPHMEKGAHLLHPVGEYKDGGQVLVFQSRELEGSVDVLAVDDDHVELSLDLTARSPTIDATGQGTVPLRGNVSAKRKATPRECSH